MNTTIIGSGVAAWTVVRELRKANPAHHINIITTDSGDFYSKPMLSNALASGKSAETLVINSADKLAQQQQVTLKAHTTVTHIDRKTRTLQTTQGDMPYEQLVLAVGATPIPIQFEGNGSEHLLSVNDLNDYAQFRQQLEGKKKIAILGAGLIGCEFANDLIKGGFEVTVFDLANAPLSRLLPPEGSHYLQQQLEQVGVQWKLARALVRIDYQNHEFKLTDSTGEQTQADLVLSAIGLAPRIQLAQACGLQTAAGILTNAQGQTNDPHIFALGDCAQYNGQYVLPYIMPVMQSARALAQTLSGKPTDIHFPAMPVTVKTPDCPTVVCPPQPNQAGHWETQVSEQGIRALFKNSEGQLLGLALLGDACKERQALAAQLPELMPKPL